MTISTGTKSHFFQFSDFNPIFLEPLSFMDFVTDPRKTFFCFSTIHFLTSEPFFDFLTLFFQIHPKYFLELAILHTGWPINFIFCTIRFLVKNCSCVFAFLNMLIFQKVWTIFGFSSFSMYFARQIHKFQCKEPLYFEVQYSLSKYRNIFIFIHFVKGHLSIISFFFLFFVNFQNGLNVIPISLKAQFLANRVFGWYFTSHLIIF